MSQIEFSLDRADVTQIVAHLRACDSLFVPSLSSRVDIVAYAGKIMTGAQRFEAWAGCDLAGLVAVYCNAADKAFAFITSVSVLHEWHGHGIASRLLERCTSYVRELGFACLELDVANENAAAIALYQKHGFGAKSNDGVTLKMALKI